MGVETVLNARVVDRPGEGLVTIEVAQARLTAMDPGGMDGAIFACIRAEEVVLERGPIGQVSARNRLEGTGSSISRRDRSRALCSTADSPWPPS